eukprot:gene31252-47110_t
MRMIDGLNADFRYFRVTSACWHVVCFYYVTVRVRVPGCVAWGRTILGHAAAALGTV